MWLLQVNKIFRFRRDSGYTLLEVLVVAGIIVILVGFGSTSYLEAQRRTKEHLCATRLQTLATYEKFYQREFGDFGFFTDLQTQGYIDTNYVENDNERHTNGSPYIPEYKIEFELPGDGTFRITAVSALEDPDSFMPRWRLTGGIWDLRTMYVDDRGIVRWEENDMPVYR
jgi:prepilin-type N-terminal cleavage/methylation domain-containing protein